ALLLLALSVAALIGVRLRAQPAATPAVPYKNPALPVDRRVEDLLARMTLREKADMLSGSGWMESQPNSRLGIPAIKMADGPMGVRNWRGSSAVTNAASTVPVTSTAFPAGIGMASSWDPELVTRGARVIAQEVKAHGRDMILGPTVNINRVPLWGRNFEGYGEDPYLAARMGVAYIRGVQAEGVIPSVKHFAANNEEYERHRIDAKIDERTLHEIYFPAFKAAVEEAGVWAVMSAYNKVNGQWCAENPYLLTDTLRKRWGFRGFVISDWGSTYSTAATINAGMDLEMPGGEPMRLWASKPETMRDGNGAGWLTADKVLAAVSAGGVSQAAVDDSVRRILRVMFTAGLFDRPHADGDRAGRRADDVDTPEQRQIARTAANESIVLLKNSGGLLPLSAERTPKIAVIGPNAAVARTGGGGSSLVRPYYAVTPLDGIREAAGPRADIVHALGVVMQGGMEGEDAPKPPPELLAEAVAVARHSDVAVVVVGNAPKLEGEGFDRRSMDLPAGQDELIEAIAAANPNTVVVVAAGAPVTMTRWIGSVPAVVYAWYGGQEAGHAVGDILFGAVNPSGKLPVTFPKAFQDSPAYGHYPGEDLHVEYAEGIYVGYRGFDKRNVEPLFPFGHGLSYTTFDYTGLKIAFPTVGVSVRNSGTRAGAEVVQLYLQPPPARLDRPVKELKAFSRIMLQPGETRTVSFTLDKAALSFYDPALHDWVAEPGRFTVLVGASSRDIRAKGEFELAR
ncbi:MAG TPA: glycoside hydrolase family 3 C-terminal domain-containing protein, partial [Bryobacteraceae bacterium]|nr:glycoside hydrolase family 3 C-terminal domain-containing protein [Bryobacteraceae bacterium]